MNQNEQLKRMRALQKDAVRLKDAIKDEINEILDDIAERRKFADECDDRATKANRTWDGKQPDFWYEAGHIWMKATDNHRGQSVLVAKDRQGMRPLDCFEAERIAKLGKVTEFGDYACYNSDETKINHWPIAWAPCTQDEVDQYRGGKFVSVVLADKMKLVKEAAKDQTEQADPLLDDPLWGFVIDAEETGDTSEIPNSSMPDPLAIPDGWRELEPDEVPKTSDMREWMGGWHERTSNSGQPYKFHDTRNIRKIEPVKEPKYREPTNDDFGKRVEVRDVENREWIELDFVSVLPPGDYRFCAEDEDGTRCAWRLARIKVDC